MKFKDIFPILGLKSRCRHYGYQIRTFNISGVGRCRYAQWLHPMEFKTEIRAQYIQDYRKIIRPGDLCIDIGARSGDTSLPMAIAAGPGGTTLAIEPNPHVFHVLQKNALANRSIANIVPIMGAASNKEGFADFMYYDPGYFNGGRHKNVSLFSHGHAYDLRVFTFNLADVLRDDFADILPVLRFIKVDCEGYDLDILKSLDDIIRKFRPYIKCEVYKKTSLRYRAELIDFLKKMDYRIRRITAAPITAAEDVTAENCMKWRHYDVLCEPNAGNGA